MYIVIYLMLIIAIAIVGFIASIVLLFLLQNEETDENYNNQMSLMCEKAKAAGVCPEVCDICAWALRKENGKVINFRGRNENK